MSKVKTNLFKQALQAEQTLYGLWQGIANTTVAEIGAGAGFDWLLIDAEHAPFDLPSILAQLQAIEPYPVSTIVRPVEGSNALIKQLLDIGAQSLLIPMVETPGQAEQIVKAAKYPPQGIRGLGTSMARAANWNRTEHYLHEANQQICIIVQIETLSGLENIEGIVAVDGVDAVFIGPSDLSAAMGHIGNPAHEEVIGAIKHCFNIINKAGKAAGALAVNKTLAEDYAKSGARFIGVGVDAALLVNATRQLASEFIERIADNPPVGY